MAKSTLRPYKAGVIVTGKETSNGIGLSVAGGAGCSDHGLWVLNKARKSDWLGGGGYFQSATCLVCGHTTAELDVSWWKEKATAKDFRRTLNWCSGEIEFLSDAMCRIDDALRKIQS